MHQRGDGLLHVRDGGEAHRRIDVQRLVDEHADVVGNRLRARRLRGVNGVRERAGRRRLGGLVSGDEQVQNRPHRVNLGALRRLAQSLVFGGEVAPEFGVEFRLGQRRDHGLAELLAGHADLAVIRDPDELRDQRSVHEPVAHVAEIGGGGQRERDFLRDDDGLIEGDRIGHRAADAARAVDDVAQRASAAVLVRDERHAAQHVDGLLFGERRTGEQRRQRARFSGRGRECLALAAEQAAQRHGAAELRAVDPSGAPEIAEGIALESFEEDERAELLVRTILRSHRRTPGRLEECRVG